MNGWMGKLLRINLTDKKIREEELKDEELYIGARGLGDKILYDEIDPGIDPLSEDNKIIFASGPLTGTLAAASGRYEVVTKAPLTGTIAGSNSGGYFGPMIKHAGYDAIVVEGKAESPVYISIDEKNVEIRSAEHLWGKTTGETEDEIKRETSFDAEIACIGPAGENKVLYACIINNKHRAAGRSGVGAVMGSKNLKAVAVRGSKGIKIEDSKNFFETLDRISEKIRNNDTTNGLGLLGTALLVNVINSQGGLPAYNHQHSVFEGANEISGEALAKGYLLKNKGCAGCMINCGRVVEIKSGRYKSIGEGPEYEAIWAMGAECGIDNLEAVSKANFIANDLGFDPISFGVTLSCAMELYEKGALKLKSDTDTELRFGDPDILVEAARKTGYREGIGDMLASGSYRLAEQCGHPELSMSSKKQEFPAYDPRVFQGMALEYATSNRGGCHVRGYTIAFEVVGVPFKAEPSAIEGKAVGVKLMQDFTAAIDSSGTCLFTSFAIDVKDLADELRYATGIDYDEKKVLECGERIWNLERMFNLRAGFSAKDDALPPRMLNEPVKEGPAKGSVAKLEPMLKEYYKLRGWSEDGVPEKETLKRLRIEQGA